MASNKRSANVALGETSESKRQRLIPEGKHGENLTQANTLSDMLVTFKDRLNLSDDELDIVNKTRELIPIVAVVGDQSSAKSSLLSTLTGLDLHVGDGTTTAGRLEIRIRRGVGTTATGWVYNHLNEIVHTITAINAESFKDANQCLINMAKQNNTEICRDHKIVIEITDPDRSNATYVDLPGMIVKTVENNDKARAIEKMIEEYIIQPNCLIVNVVNGSTDFECNNSVGPVSIFDPHQTRTLTVFTRTDARQDTQTTIQKLQQHRPKGIFVVNRRLIGDKWEPISTEEELAYFDKIKPTPIHRGRGQVVYEIEEFTNRMIAKNKSELHATCRKLENALNIRLTALGKPEKPYRVHQAWLRRLNTQTQSVCEQPKIHSMALKIKPLAEETAKVPPQIQSIDVIAQRVDEISRNGLPYSVDNLPFIREYSRESVYVLTPKFEEWLRVTKEFLCQIVESLVGNDVVSPVCLSVNSVVIKNCHEWIHEQLCDFETKMKKTFEGIYNNPSTFKHGNLTKKVNKPQHMALMVAKVAFENNNFKQGLHEFILAMEKLEHHYNNQAHLIHDLMTEYWNSRMEDLREDLFHWVIDRQKEILKTVVDKVEDLDQEHIDKLRETPEQMEDRLLLQKILELVEELLV